RTRPTPSRRHAATSTCRSSGWPYPTDTVGGSHAKKRTVGGEVPAWRPRQSASSIAMLVAPSHGSVTRRRQFEDGGPDMAPIPPTLGAPRGTRGVPRSGARSLGGPDMAPIPPTLGAPRGTRGAPRGCVPPNASDSTGG